MIDRTTSIPLHNQIFQDLLNKIKEGYYGKGTLLPSETKLQQQYGVSRITVRRAIQNLQDEGFVEKLSGKGTIVNSPKKILNLQKLSSFSQDLEFVGGKSSSVLVNFKLTKPNDAIKNRLSIGINDKVYCIERIRLSGDEKIGFHRAYILADHIDLDEKKFDEDSSLYDLLTKQGINLSYAEESIEALNPSKEIQEYLGIRENDPILYKERTTFDINNRIIEFVEIYYRGDLYKYKVKLDI